MISLLFTTSPSWISGVIRAASGSETSHVALGLDLEGVPVLLHATWGGVQVTTKRRWVRENKVVAEYEIKPDVTMWLREAVAHIGDHYDYVGLLGYAAVMLWKRLGRVIKNPLASSTAVVCSEFVLRLDGNRDLLPEWEGLDPERTTPGDLLAICRKSASFGRRFDTLMLGGGDG